MEIIVKRGAIDRHQMTKDVSKPGAIKILSDKAKREEFKSKDKWWKSRTDWSESSRNAKKLNTNLEKVMPETLGPAVKDKMWRRAKQLKDEFSIGMLSKEELHPVKGFTDNGKMVWVVDDEKMRSLRSVERNSAWYRKNEVKLREFKNIMRHLCPENPGAADVERFRPKMTGIR